MFDIGERVLCIKSGWGDSKIGSAFQRRCCPNIPYRGRIYTIRACFERGNDCWVYLQELHNPAAAFSGTEPYFEAKNFRPIKRTETDIGVFYQILFDVHQETGFPVEEDV